MRKVIVTLITLFATIAFSVQISYAAMTTLATATPAVTTTAATVRMQNIQSKADTYITERINSIKALIQYITTSKFSTSSQSVNILSNLNTDTEGLTSLKAQIDSFNAPVDIKTELLPLVSTIFTTYRIYAIALPQAHEELHIEYLQSLPVTFTEAEKAMQNGQAYAISQKVDTTPLQADFTAYQMSFASFNTTLQIVQPLITSLKPAGYPGNISTYGTIKTDFSNLHLDTETMTKDFTNFTTTYKTLVHTT